MLYVLPQGNLYLKSFAEPSAPERRVTRIHNGFSGLSSTRIPGGIVSLASGAAQKPLNSNAITTDMHVPQSRRWELNMTQSPRFAPERSITRGLGGFGGQFLVRVIGHVPYQDPLLRFTRTLGGHKGIANMEWFVTEHRTLYWCLTTLERDATQNPISSGLELFRGSDRHVPRCRPLAQ